MPNIETTGPHLPPSVHNPALPATKEKSGRTGLRKVIAYIKTSIQSLRHRSDNYELLINKDDTFNKVPEKTLKSRSIKHTPADIPINVMPFEEIPPPKSTEEKRQMVIDAEIAAYPYHRSTKAISEAGNIGPVSATPPTWKPVTDLIKDLALATKLTPDVEKGFLYDKKTGLTAYILQQPDTKEIRLVFGGTTSGLHTGGLAKRSLLSNRKFTLLQWRSNIRNALGFRSPKNFEQAKQLTTELKQLLDKTPHYKSSHLVLSGHSKGGAEAIYAALSQKEPLEARVFSCAELHQKLVKNIPTENLKQACRLVKGVNIKGDLVPNMRKLLPTKLRALGSFITLRPAHRYNLERHDSFVKHIRYFAENSSSKA